MARTNSVEVNNPLIFRDIPNSAQRNLNSIVTASMREAHFRATGYMANDEVILDWNNPPKARRVSEEYTKEVLDAFEEKMSPRDKQIGGDGREGRVNPLVQDGGGGKNYYDLPPGAEQLLDLIEHRNMNGNVKDIFKACYRLGQKEGTSEEYDLRKMVLYSLRELGRVTGRKDYIDLAIEVAGHHDRIYANTH